MRPNRNQLAALVQNAVRGCTGNTTARHEAPRRTNRTRLLPSRRTGTVAPGLDTTPDPSSPRARHPLSHLDADGEEFGRLSPIQAVLGRWDAQLRDAKELPELFNPEALKLLVAVRAQLDRAISAARETRLRIPISEAHAITGIPASTLRRACAAGDIRGAEQVAGTWYLPIAALLAFADSSCERPSGDTAEAQAAGGKS